MARVIKMKKTAAPSVFLVKFKCTYTHLRFIDAMKNC